MTLPFELTFAIATGVIVLIASLVGSVRNIEDAQKRMRKLQSQKEAQYGRLRKLARRTLDLRRSHRSVRMRIENAISESREFGEQVKRLEGTDRRLFVLDDRRTQVDRTYVARVEHPDYTTIHADTPEQTAQSWARGRRFIVWALDERKAREKIQVRYPERAGFRITGMSQMASDAVPEQKKHD